jgi:hypothetical protein
MRFWNGDDAEIERIVNQIYGRGFTVQVRSGYKHGSDSGEGFTLRAARTGTSGEAHDIACQERFAPLVERDSLCGVTVESEEFAGKTFVNVMLEVSK